MSQTPTQPEYPGYQQNPYGAPPPAPYGAYPYQQNQAQLMSQSKNGLGVAALICGIGSWVILPLLAAVAAIILGSMGKKAADQGLANNRGMSQAGSILGWINVGITVFVGVLVLILFVAGVLVINSTTY